MSSKCPLSDPSLDIIPANAHLVGNCLCQFCTCGRHLCPRMNIKDPFPRGTFTTKYMSEFSKNKFDNPVKVEPKLYRPNKLPMDLDTSNKETFKGVHQKPSTPIRPHEAITPKKPVLNSTTINSYQYPNWGTQRVTHESRWHPPVRTTELKFKGKSSYSRSFSPIIKDDANRFFTDFSLTTAYQTNFSLGPKSQFDPRTTYNDKMKNFAETGLNTRIKVRPQKVKSVQATPSNFHTTAGSFYTSPSHKHDPRQVRILLQSRGMQLN